MLESTEERLPHVERFIYQDWPDDEGELVEFRLIYKGRLSSLSRKDDKLTEKHDARKQFHRQLALLWKEHPYLSKALAPTESGGSVVDGLANDYARCGRRFVPMVNNQWGLGCALDILFLRRDQPGGLVKHGGDIDNRIKVLFDGLRMPQECSELPEPPQPDEDPFFCLLQDDSLITEVSITTDTLLLPLAANEHVHDVLLIIKVRTLVLADGPYPVMRLGF